MVCVRVCVGVSLIVFPDNRSNNFSDFGPPKGKGPMYKIVLVIIIIIT